MTRSAHVPLWVPIHVSFDSGVTWLDAQGVEFLEPFFDDTVDRVLQFRQGSTRQTGLDELAKVNVEAVCPRTFIFHSSRCGSTLFANAFRQLSDTTVISEAQPINALFGYSHRLPRQTLHALLRGTLGAFQRILPDSGNLFVKLTSWNICSASMVFEVWPLAQGIFLYRDPAEIMSSVLNDPSGWMAFKDSPDVAATLVGIDRTEIALMSREEYAARVLDRFFSAALAWDQLNPINYSELQYDFILEMIRRIGITVSASEAQAIRRCTELDSKDPKREKVYVRHGPAPSAAIREAAERWAGESYAQLECRRRNRS